MLRNSAPSPSITTRARAVATSCRPRRPSQPMDRAPMSAKTPSPISVLMPSRLAPAAPANAPCGTASATNAAPRSTMKNPTVPATTATMVPASQALVMNPENIGSGPPNPAGADPAGDPRRRHIAQEDQRDHEEADRPAVPDRRPVEAVVGQQHPQPGGGQAGQRAPGHGQSGAAGQPEANRGGPDQQRRGQDGADRHGGQGDGEGDRDQDQEADQPDTDPADGGQVRGDRAEQQRPVQDGHDAHGHHAEQRDDRQQGAADSEYGAEQDRDRGPGDVAVRGIPVEEERGQAETR